MNIDTLTEIELSECLACLDDEAGAHVPLITTSGLVHIELIPLEVHPSEWRRDTPGIAVVLETLCRGNGYVGAQAAQDEFWVRDLLGMLRFWWKQHLKRMSGNAGLLPIGP